jgi:hypothetical protein
MKSAKDLVKIFNERSGLLFRPLFATVQQALAVKLIDLNVRQPSHRGAKKPYKGGRIVGVFHHTKKVHSVDNLLHGIEVSLPLHHVSDSPSAERFQVLMDVGQCPHQNGHMPGLDDPLTTVPIENLGFSQDFFRKPPCQAFRFQSSRKIGVHLPFSFDPADLDFPERQEIRSYLLTLGLSRGMNGYVGWL